MDGIGYIKQTKILYSICNLSKRVQLRVTSEHTRMRSFHTAWLGCGVGFKYPYINKEYVNKIKQYIYISIPYRLNIPFLKMLDHFRWSDSPMLQRFSAQFDNSPFFHGPSLVRSVSVAGRRNSDGFCEPCEHYEEQRGVHMSAWGWCSPWNPFQEFCNCLFQSMRIPQNN